MVDPDAAAPPPTDRAIHASGAWAAWWRLGYRILRLGGGLLMRLALRPGYGNLVVLTVRGRRTGRARSLPLGLLRAGGHVYLGHPSGDTAWTLNVRAADVVSVAGARLPAAEYRPIVLAPGAERDD